MNAPDPRASTTQPAPRARSASDAAFMRTALALAARGWGRVAPNPLVGAVVVREGEIVGRGWHRELGGPHAEVGALRTAGARAAGATLFVNLEPCAHTGQTPPCTEAVLAAEIDRVVLGCRDPHPVARGGAERLRDAGVRVETGVLKEEAVRLNAPFLWHQRTGLPFVALKLATSRDGAIAAEPGRRTSLTRSAANREVMRLRAGFDAILVGVGTVVADDPLLTARGEPRPRVPPVRVVLDPTLRTPPGARLLAGGGGDGGALDPPAWILTCAGAKPARRGALEARGARVIAMPASSTSRGLPGRLDPGAVLAELGSRGIRSVFVEGGARVAGALVEADLVQRTYIFSVPHVLGPGALRPFTPEAAPPGVYGAGGAQAEPDAGWVAAGPGRSFGPDALIQSENRRALELLLEADARAHTRARGAARTSSAPVY